jgi:Uncharacterized conserved protein (COG2071)
VLLEDFAIINWPVDPERVQRHLPAGFEPEERSGTAYVALVAFRNHGFHFRAAPFLRLSCGQADYRTFVRRGDERGVWFFGGSLSSRLVVVATALWKMPWHNESIEIAASATDDSPMQWAFRASGSWGAATVSLTGTGRAFPRSSGFDGAGDSAGTMTDPLVGWYPRPDGAIGRYSVWHEPLQLQEAVAEVARCDVFERLGLIDRDQAPSGAGLQRTVAFDVHTSPTKIALA